QSGGDLLSGLLGAVMGGQASTAASTTGNQVSNQSQSGAGELSGLLGSLLGGQTGGTTQATGSQVANQSQSGGGEFSGLLGSLLGGQTGATTAAVGSQTTSNPIMNLVSSGQNPMVNTLIQPVVDQIAQKMGISPSIAMTIVTYAVHYMLSNHGTKLAKGEDISGVLQQHTNQDYLHSSGLSKQLANQTGLKPAAAASALSEVFKLLGTSST
ncbi:MAG: hypothetical protein ABSF99_07425, partial [Anaerolineales bacterium]